MKFLRNHLGLLTIIILVLIVAAPILTYPMGRDQGMYANIGKMILAGGTPYIDMWDIKPPPIYYVYAAGIGIFGESTAAIRAIDLSLIPLGMIGLYAIGLMIQGKRYGVLAALLYGVFYFNEDFPSLTQNDSLVTVPMIWAAYAALRAARTEPLTRSAFLWSLSTGALCGIILWFKQYFAFFVIALVIFQVMSRWRKNQKMKVITLDALGFICGGLLTGGVLLVYFWSQGMVTEMLIIAEGTAAYNAQGRGADVPTPSLLDFFYFKWLVWGPLLVLVGLWFVWKIGQFINGIYKRTRYIASLHNSATFDTSEKAPSILRWGISLILLWLASGLAFVLAQSLGFDTHWIPMLPPLALLGADVLNRVIEKSAQVPSILQWGGAFGVEKIVSSLILLVFLGTLAGTTWGRAWYTVTGQETQVAYFDRFQANDLKPEETLQVVAYLRERVVPNDTLFVWGFRPEVAYMAGLRPATRYQAQFPLVAPWYPLEWQQNNVDLLWAAMPPYALILEDDFMPWVTSIDADSHTILQDYTELNNWLIANYDRVDEIGDFLIWQRKQP